MLDQREAPQLSCRSPQGKTATVAPPEADWTHKATWWVLNTLQQHSTPLSSTWYRVLVNRSTGQSIKAVGDAGRHHALKTSFPAQYVLDVRRSRHKAWSAGSHVKNPFFIHSRDSFLALPPNQVIHPCTHTIRGVLHLVVQKHLFVLF